jgi:N-acetylmuramoyl-L-alanine amidase
MRILVVEDEKMLADAKYQNEFARAIARGVTDFVSGK